MENIYDIVFFWKYLREITERKIPTDNNTITPLGERLKKYDSIIPKKTENIESKIDIIMVVLNP